MDDLPDTEFWRRYLGRFSGVLKWRQMQALWDVLKASPEGWYVFDMHAIPEVVPEQALAGEAFLQFLDEAERYGRARHDHDYCGFIYVDDAANPGFVKIFDPKGMGTSCGCGSLRILPRWTLSRIKPDSLSPEPQTPTKTSPLKRLFSGLFGGR